MGRNRTSPLRYEHMGIIRILKDEYLTTNAQHAMPAQCYRKNVRIIQDQNCDSDVKRLGNHFD